MSIKIDLLPGYVGLRRWFRRLLWISAALLSSVGAILFVLFYRDKQQLEKLQTDYAGLATNEKIATDAKTAADKAAADAAPIATTVKFFVDAGRTGVERAELLDTIGKYIYGRENVTGASVSSIDLSDGQTLKVSATVPTPEVYATFLLNLRLGSATYPYPRGSLFKEDPRSNSVIPNGIPGFGVEAAKPVSMVIPTVQQQVLPFPLAITITAPLKYPITVPVEPGAPAPTTTGTPGAPGAPGAPPAAPVTAPPATPPPATTPAR